METSDDKRIRVLLHLSTGGLLLILVCLAAFSQGFSHWGLIKSATLVTGLVIILIGFIVPPGAAARASTNFCLCTLSIFIFLSLFEGFFRMVEFDFARKEEIWRELPPYYRKPTVPIGPVFFRRPGPEQWTGKVLFTVLDQRGFSPNPYGDEPEIRVKYDQSGFRNEEGLSAWEIAVAGDSFTELGHLAYDQLFTTILGKIINVRVLNLGTSSTGPLSHLSYLQHYGVSPSNKHAIIVFYEGNDLRDLGREYAALERYRKTGERPYREFKKQTSVVRALFDLRHTLKHVITPDAQPAAHFKSRHGDIPIMHWDIPLDSPQISAETMHQLEYFFSNYAAFGKEARSNLWLVYMPSMLRVIHGQIVFSEGASEQLRRWEPPDLPRVISAMSDRYEVNFIDLTPALVEVTERSKELLYNSIYDRHLTSQGSLVVAEEIARHLLAKDSGG